MGKKSQKPKIVLPPELPPDVPEEEIEVSDEDLKFLKENRDYAHGFSRLDTHSITKSVLSHSFNFCFRSISFYKVYYGFFFKDFLYLRNGF
jgi:hypothetical protein